MKKLEDIPKKNIFEVPEGYFDQLALNIQSKTEIIKPSRSFFSLNFALRYITPVLLAAIAVVYLVNTRTVQSTEELLSSIPSEHLIDYLHESEISEQDLLEAINFDSQDADSIDSHVGTNYFIDEGDFDEYKNVVESEL